MGFNSVFKGLTGNPWHSRPFGVTAGFFWKVLSAHENGTESLKSST
jgi:hypothetical protein